MRGGSTASVPMRSGSGRKEYKVCLLFLCAGRFKHPSGGHGILATLPHPDKTRPPITPLTLEGCSASVVCAGKPIAFEPPAKLKNDVKRRLLEALLLGCKSDQRRNQRRDTIGEGH